MNINDIIKAKESAGEYAYLWVHDTGDCMLWETADDSIDDDGRRAIGRWRLTRDEIETLVATGAVDEAW